MIGTIPLQTIPVDIICETINTLQQHMQDLSFALQYMSWEWQMVYHECVKRAWTEGVEYMRANPFPWFSWTEPDCSDRPSNCSDRPSDCSELYDESAEIDDQDDVDPVFLQNENANANANVNGGGDDDEHTIMLIRSVQSALETGDFTCYKRDFMDLAKKGKSSLCEMAILETISSHCVHPRFFRMPTIKKIIQEQLVPRLLQQKVSIHEKEWVHVENSVEIYKLVPCECVDQIRPLIQQLFLHSARYQDIERMKAIIHLNLFKEGEACFIID